MIPVFVLTAIERFIGQRLSGSITIDFRDGKVTTIHIAEHVRADAR